MKLDQRNRSPRVEVLPDTRLRITREYDLIPATPAILAQTGLIDDGITLAWGTADDKFPSARLIKQNISGQIGFPFEEPCKEPPRLTRIYEQLLRPGETQVGETDIATGQDDICIASNDFLQISEDPPIYGHVGVDSIVAGTTTCILKSDERTDDGTLKTIKRTYISAGELLTSNEIKNNGALLMRTVKSVITVPPTPAGYTIIKRDVDFPAGVPVYTYSFAKGFGQISEDIEYRNSITQGVVGLTIVTLKFLSDPSVSTNPLVAGTTAFPLAAGTSFYVLAKDTYEDADGYRVWTAVFGHGQGTIITENVQREGGKIVVYNRTALGSPPGTPSPTIGGTVQIVKTDRHFDRFHEATEVFDYQWIEGLGELSREVRVTDGGNASLNPAVDTNTGINITTIRFATPLTQATPLPIAVGTSVLVMAEKQEQEGYRVWQTVWVNGNVSDAVNEIDFRNNNTLIIYRKVGMGIVPTTPGSTIGGTVNIVKRETRKSSGYDVFDYTWAEGLGVVRDDPVERDGGLLEWRRTIFLPDSNVSGSAPVAGAILVHHEWTQEDGFVRNEAAWMLKADQTALTSGTSVVQTYGVKHPFTYPGRAKTYAIAYTGLDANASPVGLVSVDVFKSPPITQEIDATVQISYQTSQPLGFLPYTFWNPNNWVTIMARWQRFDLKPRSEIFTLPGYRNELSAGTSTVTFTSGAVFPGGFPLSVFGEAVYPATSGQILMTGGPAAPDAQTLVIGSPELVPVFYDIENSRQWYRKTIVIATIPTQPPLPV